MQWKKQGVIYCANETHPWALSHAALPVPYKLDEETIRIYCAFRAQHNVSRVGYVDVKADDPKHVIRVSNTPALDVGRPGTFDDNGVIPVSVVPYGDQLYMYYGGFELGVKVPYFLFAGLAISRDGGNSFQRYQQVPILDRSDKELFFRTATCVLKEGAIWKVWYIAGSGWVEHNGKKLPHYIIKYAESADGINWPDEGTTCIELKEGEHGFGRPYVIRNAQGLYQMYYSIRTFSRLYHLGYAESLDGKRWIRKDKELGLEVSPEGPDSEMICYSAVWQHGDRTYLFYNGNNYGGTGICYAELYK